jgi:NAD(P)-dependent dehydrogenase (short-subunit alcohol dehydrogenase family)
LNGQKTALVTGASRGLGKAFAERLAQDGMRVLIPERRQLNLFSNESIDEYLSSLEEKVDVLVNNAGINRLSPTIFSDTDLEDILQVNLIGPTRLTRGLIPGMVDRRYGRIVNISSIWSIVARPGRITYALSKASLNGYTRALAIELAPYNIMVNAVAPGYVNTELTRQNNSEQELQEICKTIPLKRLAEPMEIARLVSFLCSEENSYLTGQCLVIDGGYTCL